MAKIIKVGDNYFVEFIGNGLLFQKLAGPDKSLADKMLKDIEESLRKEDVNIFQVKEMSYAEFSQKLTTYLTETFPLKTQKRLKSTWSHFDSFLKRNYPQLTKLREITPSVVEEYRVSLIKELSSENERIINFTLFLLRVVFEFAVKCRGLNNNPTLHVKMNFGQGQFDRAVYNVEFAEQLLKEHPQYQERGKEILQTGQGEFFRITRGTDSYFLKHVFVLSLLDKGLTLLDVFKVLKLGDIARVMIYAPYEKPRLV